MPRVYKTVRIAYETKKWLNDIIVIGNTIVYMKEARKKHDEQTEKEQKNRK